MNTPINGRRGFAARPVDPDKWIRSDGAEKGAGRADGFTARLTIDVTPQMRGRIKVAAFRRNLTVADMVRELLETHFPDEGGPDV